MSERLHNHDRFWLYAALGIAALIGIDALIDGE
jgi:hypothetical protein